MTVLDDLVISVGAGVATTSLVILFSLLSRYQKAVEDARESGELAKSLWDAMNARLTIQDARIVDLMARLEVYGARKTLPAGPVAPGRVVTPPPTSQTSQASVTTSQPVSQTSSTPATLARQLVRATNDTELAILKALLEGPKMSNSIREVIQVTREHNARLLKGLYERGLVARNDQHKPFVYEITEAGRNFLGQTA